MKVEWADSDIRPGRIVTTNSINHNHMIGYRVTDAGNVYGIIDLRDGMFACQSGAKAALAETLNKEGFFPIELRQRAKDAAVSAGQRETP